MASGFPHLDGIYGPLEIGQVVGAFLFGIQTLQCLHYFREFPKDSARLKAIVALVWFLELGEKISGLHQLYSITITFYGEPPSQILAKPPHSSELQDIFSVLSLTVVQLFFGNRVRILSGNWIIMFLSLVLSLFTLIVALISVAQVWTSTSAITTLEVKLRWVNIAAMSATPILDILIASFLCFYLWKFRKSEFRSKTHRMLDTLTLWTIETTFLTSICAIMQVILFLVNADLSRVAFQSIQSKLFASSMLAVLNGRTRFRSNDDVAPAIPDDLAFNLSERRNDEETNNPTFLHSHRDVVE
ncbi:Saposin B-type domain-containing protein [Mycena venus]|uniref:Saposin B-type domain-containing protein n=1 Tax=Mycena venus TaxID=2733690 RepID=A0A8H6XIK0_9AGAR|nr:Saposin B-type domain-containing protein [Mycena venus]